MLITTGREFHRLCDKQLLQECSPRLQLTYSLQVKGAGGRLPRQAGDVLGMGKLEAQPRDGLTRSSGPEAGPGVCEAEETHSTPLPNITSTTV